MAYFPDLAPYTYLAWGVAPGVVTVGWLEPPHDVPRAPSDPAVHDQLWRFVSSPLLQTRGFHVCPWCETPTMGPLPVRRGEEILRLGSAEIRVFGHDGVIYAAPDLIYHYVVDHQYSPPAAFIDALLHGPQPGTPVYRNLLAQYDWD